MKRIVCFLVSAAMFVPTVSVLADDEPVILNPGTLSGSVSLVGYTIKSVTVYAIDTVQLYSASVAVNVPAGASSTHYMLTVERDCDYYAMVGTTGSVRSTGTSARRQALLAGENYGSECSWRYLCVSWPGSHRIAQSGARQPERG